MLHSHDAAIRRSLTGTVVALIAVTFMGCGTPQESEPAPMPVQSPAQQAHTTAIQDGYAGSQACADCHQEQHASWEASRHKAIFRVGGTPAWRDNPPPAYSSDTLVAAPLSDGSGIRVEKGGALGTFPIDAVIGGKRMESYATRLDDGAYLLLPLTYQVESRSFMPYTEGTCGIEMLNGNRVIAWQSYERVWNHRCIDCHTTAGSIGFDTASMSYNTTFVDDGAGCESCHGPGEDHIQAATAEHILNPADLDARGEAEVCASCHALALPFESRWGGNRPYRPGDDWAQAFLPLLRQTDTGPFAGLTHADLTPAAGVMEYQGLTQSLCFLQGEARCSTCHDPHDGGLQAVAEADTSLLCASCHADVVAAGEDHSHHAAGRPGSACVDCHMPPNIQAQGTRLANHAIDVPLPVNNVQFGIPDACTLCHGDRGADWADAQYRTLWGDPEDQRRRRLTLALAGSDPEGLRRILADAEESDLLRANAATSLARSQGLAAIPDLVALADSSAPLLVRRYAVDLLGSMGAPAGVSFQEKADHLEKVEQAGVHEALRRAADSGEAVLRLGAAAALSRLGAVDGLTRLEAMRDDPELAGGYRLHYTLAKYNLLNGRLAEAAREYEMVLQITPNYLDAIQDLGFVYFSSERFTEARDLWMRGLVLDPGNEQLRERIHHAEDQMRKSGVLPPVSGG